MSSPTTKFIEGTTVWAKQATQSDTNQKEEHLPFIVDELATHEKKHVVASQEEETLIDDQSPVHILFPGGGDFNKLRKKQKFLHTLLEENVDAYITSTRKRQFVKNLLAQIPGGIKIYSKTLRHVYDPEENEAFHRVAQKLRDIKKYRKKRTETPMGMTKNAIERTTTKPSKYRKKLCVLFYSLSLSRCDNCEKQY